MTRTPEEIKKGLECCAKGNSCRGHCPYDGRSAGIKECTSQLARDALTLIPRWISVEERLPEHWHMDDKGRTLINYLVYSPDYGVDVGNYIKSAKRWVCMGLPMNVTHWMPLPEPPEEVQTDG